MRSGSSCPARSRVMTSGATIRWQNSWMVFCQARCSSSKHQGRFSSSAMVRLLGSLLKGGPGEVGDAGCAIGPEGGPHAGADGQAGGGARRVAEVDAGDEVGAGGGGA